MAGARQETRAEPATADREIVIDRVIDAPRELVFEAFTEVRHLSRWWGPEGFTTTTRAFEFRVVVVNPFGPHHCDRCRTSVNASNTSSRGALMTREITTSRSAVALIRYFPFLVRFSFCTYSSSRSKLSLQNRSNPPAHS